MQVTVGKIAALVITLAYAIVAFIHENSLTIALMVLAGAILPLALIWFPEILGGFTGWGSAPVDRPSPPLLVLVMGWFLLLGLPLLLLFALRLS
jgi:hypothetical protein